MCNRKQIPLRKDGFASWAATDTNYNVGDTKETRSIFKHDGDVIVYSSAFRRLSNKSQIVVKPEVHGEFRSRLTHTLEVMRTATSIGIPLALNSHLIDAIALGHDIGHSPFGHAGEKALQLIMRSDVLPNCNQDKLKDNFLKTYNLESLDFEHNGDLINGHWLFHHALNSVRIMQRKMRDVSGHTNEGVLKHGWSPWKPGSDIKFDVPSTYEAQAVAIADQVAGLNHDMEDILSSKQSGFTAEKMHRELPTYISAKTGLNFSVAQDIVEGWFLPIRSDADSAWMRKQRLQAIINSIITASGNYLVSEEVVDNSKAESETLRIDREMGLFLEGYESFLREVVLANSWFDHRDRVASAIIQTVYTLLRPGPDSNVPNYVEQIMERYKKSIAEPYDKDQHFRVFRDSAKANKADEIVDIIKTIDFVSGMTDDYIMNCHKAAITRFTNPCIF